MQKTKRNVDTFNQEAIDKGGYIYTHPSRLSMQFSNDRMTRGLAEITEFKHKTILDLGCGDGVFTLELAQLHPKYVVGIDPAAKAIETASIQARNLGLTNLSFEVGNLYDLENSAKKYDIVLLRSVLHHVPNPALAISIAAKLADELIILEPNGSNPILKVIEKVSTYHIEHEEQSYSLRAIKRWLADVGFRIEKHQYIGLVPMFCPDKMAKVCKTIEPVVERIPWLRTLGCAQYVLRACR